MRTLKFLALGIAIGQFTLEMLHPDQFRVPLGLALLTFAIAAHWAGRPGGAS